ncbi:hypothetical protein F2P45_27420 [Massilia sp. CCM 8733]|uniref:Uncharacterized protein n=1 Tax=Massilia mucilaginosa TaxID=2609282 RepID=A0ABX0P0A1_9BURK|nr:hypothetical protein [Massilia mucilaginosa]NHZ92708.1 hypothetical protein [Massilia mucilaginosa]
MSDVVRDDTPDADDGAMLTWRDGQYDEVPGVAQAALGFLIGSGVVVVPVAVLYLLLNLLKAVISFFKGGSPSWLILDHPAHFIIALLAVAFGGCLCLICVLTKEIIRYDIDLHAGQLTLHHARFPKRVVIVTMPLSAIVSIAPYTRTSHADTGGFYFTHVNHAGKPVQWETRDSIPVNELRVRVQVLKGALGELLHDWVHHDT